MLADWIVSGLVVLGSLVVLISSIGILRFPDVLTRMHAASKGSSLGVGVLIIAAVLANFGYAQLFKGVITIVFVFLTVPVGAILLGHFVSRSR